MNDAAETRILQLEQEVKRLYALRAEDIGRVYGVLLQLAYAVIDAAKDIRNAPVNYEAMTYKERRVSYVYDEAFDAALAKLERAK